MKATDLFESTSTQDLVKDGKLKKIELYVSTGDGFADRFAEFLEKVGNITAAGASRSIGILDPAGPDEKIKIFIDGDGADRLRDIKIV
jgi:hypothetical protein